MFKTTSRYLCFLLSFQLLMSCNVRSIKALSAGQAVDGGFFDITGTIVKSFQKVNNLIMPSAIAASGSTHTGDVRVFDFRDPLNVVEIASVKLYDNEKTFQMKLPKEAVIEGNLKFQYVNTAVTDQRLLIADPAPYISLNVMDVVLDANATFETVLLEKEIAKSGKTSIKDLNGVIAKFKPSRYLETLRVGQGEPSDFTIPYVSAKAAEMVYKTFNKLLDAKEFTNSLSDLKGEARDLDIKGARLNCTGAKVSADATASFQGELNYETQDEQTGDTLGWSKTVAGKLGSVDDVVREINGFYSMVQSRVNQKGFTAIFKLKFSDQTNKLITTCSVEVAPAPPEASRVSFDKLDLAKAGKLANALSLIDDYYDSTVTQLEDDFDDARLDPYGDDKELFDAQMAIIDGWYNESVDAAIDYFKKK